MIRRYRQAILGIVVFLLLLSGFIVARVSASNGSSVFLPLLSKPLPYPLWAVTIGGSEYEQAVAIAELVTGDLLAVGYLSAPSMGLIARIRPTGAILWQDNYQDITFTSAASTNDGGVIAVGTEQTSTGQNSLVLRLGADGNRLWARSFIDSELIWDVDQSDDGGFLVVGYRPFFGPWIFKLNPDGTATWQRQYGSDVTVLDSIAKTSDGGAIVTGSTTNSLPVVMKLNADGTIYWQRSYEVLGGVNFSSIMQVVDGGYMVVGSGLGGNGWIVKLENDGLVDWQYTYDQTGGFGSITLDSDGGYVVASHSGELLHVDANGSAQWLKKYTGGQFNSTIEVDSGGYAVAGSYPDDQGERDIFALRVNDVGDVINCDIIETVVSQANVLAVTVGVTNIPATVITYDSNPTQPTIIPGNPETTTICPAHSEAYSSQIATGPGC